MAGDFLECEGTVAKVHKGDLFTVEVELPPRSGQRREVLCKPSGRMRHAHVHLLLADRVRVEVCPLDLERGRIVYRL